MLRLLFLLFLLSFLHQGFTRRIKRSAQNVDSKISVNDRGHFVDQWGRVRIFHGFNAVNKHFPWYPTHLLNETRLQLYQDWGFNVVRLGSMWSGAVPAKGNVNNSYLDVLERIIDGLGNHGLYSFLDMHQDVISSKYGTYDGVPRWLIDSFPKPTIPYPFPVPKAAIKRSWGLGYVTLAVGEAFEHLYKNSSNAWDHWALFWKTLAKRFGEKNAVLAYEFINEPWAGNVYGHPELIEPGQAGRLNLQPVYDYLAAQISQVDNRTIFFYEPVTWGIYGSGPGPTGCGFEHVPGGAANRFRSALSYHFYCWLLKQNDHEKPYPYWERLVCDELLLEQMFRSLKKDTSYLGGAKFLTEFGECGPDNSSVSINTLECEQIVKQSDDNLQSWTYWDTEFFNSDGSVQWFRLEAFSRAYPRATAGEPTTIKFDVKTGEFIFEYLLDAKIKMATEIYLPVAVHYEKGFELDVSPSTMTYKVMNKNLLMVGPDDSIKDGTTVKVYVTRKFA